MSTAEVHTAAQRLIAVSLGKIQASRIQRGGPCLHKSLLVSAVLHKARTQIMMENFHAMMAARRAQMDTQQQLQQTHERQFMDMEAPLRPPTPCVSLPANQEALSAGKPGDDDDSQAKRARVENPRSCGSFTDENKENSPPIHAPVAVRPTQVTIDVSISATEPDVDNSSPDCAKCVKRRLSEVEDNTEDCSNVKRIRSDSESSTSDSHSDCDRISSLVHKFNSGLSGFLGTASFNNSSNNTQGESISSSCATQVGKDVLDCPLSTRPVIALTV